MSTRKWIVSVMLAAALFLASVAKAEEPSAELKVLDQFTGNWDETWEMPDGTKGTAITVGKWILNNTHVQMDATVNLPDGQKIEHLFIFTWDAVQKTYRGQMFSTRGGPMNYKGAWDAATKTWTASFGPTPEGFTIAEKAVFVSAEKVEWTIEGKDGNGTVVFSMKGVNTKKKKEEK